MTLDVRLQANSGRLFFAAGWAGILAVLWRYVLAIAEFHVMESTGKQFDWALALLLRTALYLAILTLLLWIGLAVYLAAIHQFKLHNLGRGLGVILLVLFAALGIESFIRAEQLSPVAEYILRWLPMFASIYVACRLAVPRKPGELFSRAAGKG